jgi:hypothetical protein
MVYQTKSRRSPRRAIARGGATKQSTTVQHGLDCFASLATTETGIGPYRRELVLGRALAEPCPSCDGRIPVLSVSIQLDSCIFPVINRKSTRIFMSPSIHDSDDFSKNLWRGSALRLPSGRGEKRPEGQCRRRACATLARHRTIGPASPSRRDPLAASGQLA